jgi:hypothetical protein
MHLPLINVNGYEDGVCTTVEVATAGTTVSTGNAGEIVDGGELSLRIKI